MKMRIAEVRVKTYKTGAREGDWRTFELPEGAVVLDTHLYYSAVTLARWITITYAVPA